MTTIKSDDQILAEYMADPGAAETAHAYAHLSGSSLPKVVASVWNEAQALYLLLRQEYAGSGPRDQQFRHCLERLDGQQTASRRSGGSDLRQQSALILQEG